MTGLLSSSLTGNGSPLAIHPGYHISTWQVTDGLPQNSVGAVLQSRDGYLWVGTFNGLARFDGVRFQTFDVDTTPELRSGRILALEEDRDGVLWIGTEGGGLSQCRNGVFAPMTDKLLLRTSVASLAGSGSAMWVGTVDGNVLRVEKGKSVLWPKGNARLNGSVTVASDRGQNIWVATSEFLGRVESNQVSTIYQEANGLIEIAAARHGGVWAVHRGHLELLRLNALPMDLGEMPFARSDVVVTTLFEDHEGAVWIGTYGSGVFRYKDGEFQPVPGRDGVSHDAILSIEEDDDGGIWIGTNGSGLNRLKERIFTTYDSKNGLSDNMILSVCAGRGGVVWIGTDSAGLNRLQGGTCRVFTRKDGLKNESIWALHEDRAGVLWVGTWGGGVYRYDGTNFVHFGKREGLSSMYVRAIFEDRAGTLWFGTYDGGLNHFEKGRFKSFTTASGLVHNDVRAIYEDAGGAIWVGTGGGVSCLRNDEFQNFNRENGLPSNFVRTFFEDQDKSLWIGTSGGLCLWRDGEFHAVTRRNGLHDNVISQVFQDEGGNLWMGSNHGIFRARKKELEAVAGNRGRWIACTSYDRADGLGSAECSGGFQSPGCKTADGRLWFPTTRGVAVVNPTGLKINRRPPKVIIEDVSVDGLRVPMADRIHLGSEQKYFEFRFTGLGFDAPRRIKFKYKLEGLDEEWMPADTRRLATYHQVPPGKYRFHVKAANNDGYWNDEGASIAVVVLPPFWKTGWFLSASALVLLAASAGLVRYLSWQSLQRQVAGLEKQHAVEMERSRISKDMHDSLGGSLTQIGLLGEIVRRKSAEPVEIETCAGKISTTARDMAQMLDEIVWAANPKCDTLEELVSYLVHHAEEVSELAGMRCHLDIPLSIPEIRLSVEARHNLFLVAREAFNNMAKYAKATEASLSLRFEAGTLSLTIRDNGSGFHRDQVPAGNGIGNMQKRVEDIGGRFELWSEPGSGTRISVVLKLRE